ncbi:Transcriptional regulator, AbiEi antitoxin, Type IV TA system [Mesonia phycicola]|uniref:Transcriptional regulator, AbiEi antitoxin, Type IV TA system n=1 Tax=Mesonia phycicola TaxID=579105 RepID=A0A1M6EZK5_9FLAO|nr:DUF6088 family protein [Mesonia phycicola]SHI90819.1 Transcriptional regulator, AbiEi antitoxin, Type IV TA system [Mesonia phycicola]
MGQIKTVKSVKEKIKSDIQLGNKGKIVLPSDFEIKYGVENTKKSLLRLTNEGFLERLARGIYLYPERDELLGVLYPDIETIAEEIALRDNARIIPTGLQALNLLGLSTQVPLNVVFLTDGSPRTIKIGKRKIKFKKASPKNLAAKGRLSGLAIQALKEIGKEKVTKEKIAKIKEQLKKEEPEFLYHDMKLAPSWIANIFGDLLMYYYE